MTRWAILFAIAAAFLGIVTFGGLAGEARNIAKMLFWSAVVTAVLLFVLRRPPDTRFP